MKKGQFWRVIEVKLFEIKTKYEKRQTIFYEIKVTWSKWDNLNKISSVKENEHIENQNKTKVWLKFNQSIYHFSILYFYLHDNLA